MIRKPGSTAKLILLAAVLSLSGCTTVLRPVLHLALAANPAPIWGASPNAGARARTITWHSNLPGRSKYTGPKYETAGVLNEGAYAGWNWSIRGPADVRQSYQLWVASGSKLAQTYGVAYDWQSGMRQLYGLTTYLLGAEPGSLRARVLLVPKDSSFHEQSAEPIGAPTTLTIAVPFTTSTRTTEAAQVERFADMREAISLVGGQLQHVELLAGITAAPSSGWARAVKDEANSFCWRLAARPALAAYADIQLKTSAGREGMDNINLVRSVSAADSRKHPQDDVLLTVYAASTVIAGADKYLKHRGLSWPRTGVDIDGINALLEYCRAFVHYQGDVTTDPMPLAFVEPIPFFTKAVDVGSPQAVHEPTTD